MNNTLTFTPANLPAEYLPESIERIFTESGFAHLFQASSFNDATGNVHFDLTDNRTLIIETDGSIGFLGRDEKADTLFAATGLSHLLEEQNRVEADENEGIPGWSYALETGETVFVNDDGTVTLFDADGIGRVYTPEMLQG